MECICICWYFYLYYRIHDDFDTQAMNHIHIKIYFTTFFNTSPNFSNSSNVL